MDLSIHVLASLDRAGLSSLFLVPVLHAFHALQTFARLGNYGFKKFPIGPCGPFDFSAKTFVILTLFNTPIANSLVKSLGLVLLDLLGIVLKLGLVQELRAKLLMEGQLVGLRVVRNVRHQLLQERVQHVTLGEKDQINHREQSHDCFSSFVIHSLYVCKFNEQRNTNHGGYIDTVERQLFACPLVTNRLWHLEDCVILLTRQSELLLHIFKLSRGVDKFLVFGQLRSQCFLSNNVHLFCATLERLGKVIKV